MQVKNMLSLKMMLKCSSVKPEKENIRSSNSAKISGIVNDVQ